MKTNPFSLYLSIALIALIFGSCATSHVNNGSILNKRKHTKGFHMSWNSGTKKSELKQEMDTDEMYILVEVEAIEKNSILDNSIAPALETSHESTHPSVEKNSAFIVEPQPRKKSISFALNRLSQNEENFDPTLVDLTKKVSSQESQHNNRSSDVAFILILILCFLLPPLAVFLHRGGIDNMFWISLILTLLFWVPGIIFALWVVLVN